MAPVVDGFPEERMKGMVFGDALSRDAQTFRDNIQAAEKSDLQVVVIPDSYFGYYTARFETCRSDLYMEAFDGQRYLHTIQSEDFGMAFMADLFRCNPRMLMSLIALSETSQTMEKRSAAMVKYPKFERTVRGVPKPLEMISGGKLGNGFAADDGVRVLLHKFTTRAHCGNMVWHVDDWANSTADGSYRMATIILPATLLPSDAVCTEIDGYDFKVPAGTGIWLPCNVLHRGVPTSDLLRNGLMIEFIAAGRRHTSAANHNHQDVKDWLYFSKNTLMGHVRTPQTHTCPYLV